MTRNELIASQLASIAAVLLLGAAGHDVRIVIVAFVVSAACGGLALTARLHESDRIAAVFDRIHLRPYYSLIIVWFAQFVGASTVGVLSGHALLAPAVVLVSIVSGGAAPLLYAYATGGGISLGALARHTIGGPLLVGEPPPDDRCWLCRRPGGAEALNRAIERAQARGALDRPHGFAEHVCIACDHVVAFDGDPHNETALYAFLNSPPKSCPQCSACCGCSRVGGAS